MARLQRTYETHEEKVHLEDQDVDGRMILKYNLEKYFVE
jgi:hypothetical protein